MSDPNDYGQSSPEPRLISSSRRSFLRRGAAVGGLAAFLAACGNNDAEVFATNEISVASSSANVPSSAPTTGVEPAVSTDSGDVTTTTSQSATEPPSETPTTEPATSANLFPAGAELAIAFTYEFGADQARNLENPYLASWVEDPDGNLVSVVSLWVMQDDNPDQRALRWLSRLREWSAISGDTTISSATRVPGDFVVAWDGTDDSGARVPLGDYVLFIEGVRRGGTYSITSTPITISDTPFRTTMAANGEIVSASAELII